jgi:hypothetical protein
VLLSVAAALALVIMVNYLATRHFVRFTWAPVARNQLSALSLHFLQSLTNQVKVWVFFDRQESLYSPVSSLLKEYELACPRLKVEYVDYLRNPGRAQFIKERYRLAAADEASFKNLVIFDSGVSYRIVHEAELSDYDVSGILSGTSREAKRTAFKGELLFTSALLNVVDPHRPKAYFLQGHREHDPNNDDAQTGYSKFSALLQQSNIQTDQLVLGSNDMPPDCSLLIIAGPRLHFEPAELEKIDKYLNQGGRLLVLLNNLGKTGLEKTLAGWGIKTGDNLVLEAQSTAQGPDTLPTNPDLVVTNYLQPSHPILRPLLRSRLHLVLPRSVEKQPTGRQDADSPRVEELAGSGHKGIAVTDIRTGVPYPDPFRDRRGAIPVLVAVEKGSVQGISSDRGSTRLVVVGDSIFLGNAMIDSLANRDFAVLAVNWLLDRSVLMGGIGPRPVKEFQLVMTPAELVAVRWVLLLALPGSVMLLGLLVWWRRRN